MSSSSRQNPGLEVYRYPKEYDVATTYYLSDLQLNICNKHKWTYEDFATNLANVKREMAHEAMKAQLPGLTLPRTSESKNKVELKQGSAVNQITEEQKGYLKNYLKEQESIEKEYLSEQKKVFPNRNWDAYWTPGPFGPDKKLVGIRYEDKGMLSDERGLLLLNTDSGLAHRIKTETPSIAFSFEEEKAQKQLLKEEIDNLKTQPTKDDPTSALLQALEAFQQQVTRMQDAAVKDSNPAAYKKALDILTCLNEVLRAHKDSVPAEKFNALKNDQKLRKLVETHTGSVKIGKTSAFKALKSVLYDKRDYVKKAPNETKPDPKSSAPTKANESSAFLVESKSGPLTPRAGKRS